MRRKTGYCGLCRENYLNQLDMDTCLFRILLVAIILFTQMFSIKSQTGGDAVIYTDDKGKKIDYFFYDLKGWSGSIGNADRANQLFVNDDHNGIRIPIWGDTSHYAHPSPGVVVSSKYDQIVNGINRAKTARTGKPLYIFASKKLKNQGSFPHWTKDETGIIPKQYAILIADFIQHMNSRSVTIDYLGIDNEYVYNEGKITPLKYKQTIDELKILAEQRGFDMPILVGYEDYGPNKRDWVKKLFDNGWGDYMDIYGTHYYPQWRPYDKLKKDLSFIGDRPFWATEPHWDAKAEINAYDDAEAAMVTLWEQIDLGMSGFMWWNYRYSKKAPVRMNLMRAASVPLLGAYPIRIEDIDGGNNVKESLGDKLQTRAFIEEGKITVYAINMKQTAYNDYGFSLNSKEISGEVTYKQWVDGGDITATECTATLVDNRKFSQTLPSRSITVFSFNIKSVGVNEHFVDTDNLRITPNPALDVINISGINSGELLQVYSISGKLILEGKGKTVNVSSLQRGLYLLRTRNNRIEKFIKN